MKTRSFFLASIVILATLFITGVVFAEGEVPPEIPAETPIVEEEAVALEAAPPPAEGEPAPEEPAVPAPVQPVEEDIPSEPMPTVTVIQPEAPAIEAAPVEEVLPVVEVPVVLEAAPEALIPDQTIEEPVLITAEPEIVLVDQAGEPVDMASQASADAIASADPYFTVGLITYRFSEALDYCASSLDPVHCFDGSSGPPVTNAIQAAIDYIWNILKIPPTDGKIYVQKAVYGNSVIIDASQHPELSTLKGLIGLLDPVTGEFPTISNNISIWHLSTGFTLSGFTINGIVDIDGVIGTLTLTDLDVSDPAGGGIEITAQKGNVVMTNVRSSHNAYTGANIENTAGGNVTITNSAFDDNGAGEYVYGLEIDTNGAVTINGISASRNYNSGGNLFGFSSLSLKNAVFNGNETQWGLDAYTLKAAPVVIQNLTANYNAYTGLFITTKGSISVTAVDAHHNQTGIRLFNSDGTGAITLASVRADWNSMRGIDITTMGTTTLTDTSANNNSGSGVILKLPGTLSMTNVTASYNSGDGFYINGGKVITIRNLTAISNNGTNSVVKHDGTDGFGLEVYPVIVAGSTFTLDTATISENNDGMIVGAFYNSGTPASTLTSLANVTIRNVTASNNLGFGLFVSRTKGTVTLTNIQANDNVGGDGVRVESGSSVLLTSITATGNGENGLFIKGVGEGFAYASGVYVATSVKSPTAITITSPTSALQSNKFDGNGANGIQIATGSPVSLSNFSASANTGSGLIIEDFSYCIWNNGICSENPITYPGNVTISANILNYLNNINENSTGDGISIISKGTISISKSIVEDNGGEGININNTYASGNLPVTLTNCLANGNGWSGIEIDSKGSVTLTNTGAEGNATGHGAYIVNTLSTAASGVTIKSSTTAALYNFSANGGNGIFIESKGIISVGNVTANSNGNNNIDINNTSASDTAPKSITLIRATANSSTGGDGFYIQTEGSVTLNSLKANNNNDAGLLIEAYCSGCPTPANVTLAGSGNEFNENLGFGVSIEAEGNIALTNITADRNNAGIQLKNDYAGSIGSVTISAAAPFWSSFSENTNTGLLIYTKGAVSITNTDARDNGSTGLDVEDTNYPSSVTIRNTVTTRIMSFSGNGGYGIYAPATYGAISLSGLISASNNTYDGAYLVNDFESTKPMPVTISSLTASGNQGAGIFVDSTGAVTLTSITANDNQSTDYGVYIFNNYFGMPGSVTINGSNFISNNKGDGLEISTNGTLSITGVRAENNSKSGLILASTTDGKIVTLSNIIAQYNGNTGVDLDAKGTTTLTNVRSCANGTTGVSADGINITMTGTYHTYINNSAAIGNTGSGIYINKIKSLLHLLGTYYFGNNSDNMGVEKDLYYFIPA